MAITPQQKAYLDGLSDDQVQQLATQVQTRELQPTKPKGILPTATNFMTGMLRTQLGENPEIDPSVTNRMNNAYTMALMRSNLSEKNQIDKENRAQTGTQNVTTIGENNIPTTQQVPRGKVMADPNLRANAMTNMQNIRTWQDITKTANPKTASQGTSLGMAGVNDQRSDRALDLLNKPGKLTPQELSIITTDLAAIVRGGVPTDIGARDAEYNNLSTGMANWYQKLSSGTADVDSPEVRQQLRQDMQGMKDLSRNIINDNFDYIESMQSGFINSHKNDWEKMRQPYRQATQAPSTDIIPATGNRQPTGQASSVVDYKTKYGLQ